MRGDDTLSIKEQSTKTDGMGDKPNKCEWGTQFIYEKYMVSHDNDRLCGSFQAMMDEKVNNERQKHQEKSQGDG